MASERHKLDATAKKKRQILEAFKERRQIEQLPEGKPRRDAHKAWTVKYSHLLVDIEQLAKYYESGLDVPGFADPKKRPRAD